MLLALFYVDGAVAQSTKERIAILEDKAGRLERMLQNSQQSQADAVSELQALRSENQELRNELETLQFESNRSADRQRQLYIDLDQRLQAIESRGGAGSAGVGGAAGAGGTQTDREAYQAAFDELREGRYKQAGKGFALFLAEFPDSQLRDNAQYWLAETHYVSKDFNEALAGFQKVIADYPSSRKVSDAWLKIGFCQYELKNYGDARQALVNVTNQFPQSTAGKLARERLAAMDSEGV